MLKIEIIIRIINGHCEVLVEMFQNTTGIPVEIKNLLANIEEELKRKPFPEKVSGIYKPIHKDLTQLEENPFL